jgi:hypothetical protein
MLLILKEYMELQNVAEIQRNWWFLTERILKGSEKFRQA